MTIMRIKINHKSSFHGRSLSFQLSALRSQQRAAPPAGGVSQTIIAWRWCSNVVRQDGARPPADGAMVTVSGASAEPKPVPPILSWNPPEVPVYVLCTRVMVAPHASCAHSSAASIMVPHMPIISGSCVSVTFSMSKD